MKNKTDGFKYKIYDNKICIHKYIGKQKNIQIPEFIDGFPVCKIESNTFFDKKIIAISIPSTIEEIGDYAFANNNLSSIELPNSIIKIGLGAFSNNKLSKIQLPTSLTIIESYTFANNLIKEVYMQEGIVRINSHAFYCNLITTIDLPKSLKEIGYRVFADNQIKDLSINNYVVEINNVPLIDKMINVQLKELFNLDLISNRYISFEGKVDDIKNGLSKYKNEFVAITLSNNEQAFSLLLINKNFEKFHNRFHVGEIYEISAEIMQGIWYLEGLKSLQIMAINEK